MNNFSKTQAGFLFLIILLITCFTSKNCYAQDFNEEKDVILHNIQKQENAWNDGDLEAYMQAYWKSDSLRFITQKGVTKGWTKTLHHYQTAYPNIQTMGRLSFSVISIEFLCYDKALVVGSWLVTREKDQLFGYFTLIWQNINGKWVITVDHTS